MFFSLLEQQLLKDISKMTRIKTGASKQTHYLVASFLWTVIGLFLLGRGVGWFSRGDIRFFLLPSLAIGTAKSFFILDRVAKNNIERIKGFKKNICMGGVYSVKTWILVIFMIFAGHFLRSSGLPSVFLGFVYVAIGWALFFSSRLIWRQWLVERSKNFL